MINSYEKNLDLGRSLVLGELFDLTLYKSLLKISDGDRRKILEELIPVETKHYAFWQQFFGIQVSRLNFLHRVKLWILVAFCRIFKKTAFHLVLEAIEIFGIRKYLDTWHAYKDTPLGHALKEILNDEFTHEDSIVSQMTERKINPQRVRSIFLGFNDGMVEILGAVSGFFAAFNQSSTILIASSTIAIAGSISMAAGAFVAESSEAEINNTELEKQNFLRNSIEPIPTNSSPLHSAFLVGISYLVGALVPVLPVMFGATNVGGSIIAAGGVIILVSFALAFLSGMNIKKRIITNLVIIAAAVSISYLIGLAAKSIWGINI